RHTRCLSDWSSDVCSSDLPVGARLALAARALAYGEKIEYSGPVIDAMKVTGDHAVLTFTHRGGGLVAKDGELKGFTIAGADKKRSEERRVGKECRESRWG